MTIEYSNGLSGAYSPGLNELRSQYKKIGQHLDISFFMLYAYTCETYGRKIQVGYYKL